MQSSRRKYAQDTRDSWRKYAKILTIYKIYDNINNGDDYVKKKNREKTN